jgi:hypothetical protein
VSFNSIAIKHKIEISSLRMFSQTNQSKELYVKQKKIRFSKTKIFRSSVQSVSISSANLSALLSVIFHFRLKHQTEERH